MNRIHRIIWSKIREKWIVVSEKSGASGCPMMLVGALSLAALLAASTPALALDPGALPTNGRITFGTGNINVSGTRMTVTQNTAKMIANWSSFDIGADAAVRFEQPDASSTVLNRIEDQDPSQILGNLSSNGTVFLLNPNGIIFGKTARVDVGGLVASTLNLSDNDFLGNRYSFIGNGNGGSVVNQGTITAMPGGVVALIAPKVVNEGSITADRGSVAMLAGDKVTVDFNGDGLIRYTVDQGAVDALAENKGLIQADGGMVVMNAQAADALSRAVVSNSGEIRARTLENKAGRILLLSDMEHGTTVVDGRIDATAPAGGDGGFVETSGSKVSIGADALVDTRATGGSTGTWLIDPNDYTIAASGGDATGEDVSGWLKTSNVTISTATMGLSGGNGDIFVNDSITWSANTLTLNAERNITINSALYGSGTAGLSLFYGQGGEAAGNTATYSINAPVNLARTGSFSTKLGNNGAERIYTIITNVTDLQGMQGNLGQNYVLGSNIDASDTRNWNPDDTGGYSGFNPVGDSGTAFTGFFDGLGHLITGLMINRSSDYVGLFGYTGTGASVRNVGLVGGSITGGYGAAALVGNNGVDSFISNCYSTASVAGGNYFNIGNLVGMNSGTIANSYSTGSVRGGGSVGGLVGNNQGTIINSYSTGSVTGIGRNGSNLGGLVGYNGYYILSSYSTGPVTGIGQYIGGLTGFNTIGTVVSSYWDNQTSGNATSGDGTGYNTGITALSTAEMMTKSKFSGWDFTNTWFMIEGSTRPFLRSEWSTTITNAHQLQLMSMNLGGRYKLANDIDMSELTRASGMWNTTKGFVPVASTTFFTGRFDGQGHTINGLMINTSLQSVGLFGRLGAGAMVSNVGLAGGSITGTTASSQIGALVGWNVGGTVTNSYSSLSVVGTSSYIGGLAGVNQGGTIANSYTTGSVSGSGRGSNVGGLVGYNSQNASISNSYSTSIVNGSGSESRVGGLVGLNQSSSISNSYSSGNVNSSGSGSNVGGLVGYNYSGSIINSYANGSVTGIGNVGGLVGYNSQNASISNSYSTGIVNGSGSGSNVGGLVGYNYNSSISNSYSIGNVNSSDSGSYVGGLAGVNSSGSIINSYANGSVTGIGNIGGLVGYNYKNSSISNSYSTGSVTGNSVDSRVGGLVGYNNSSKSISYSYSRGQVIGMGPDVGGFIGRQAAGPIEYCYWDTDASPNTPGVGTVVVNNEAVTGLSVNGVNGLTAADMKKKESFVGWDMADTGGTNKVWRIYDGKSYPLLRSFLTPLTITANDDTVTYNGQAYNRGNGVTYSITVDPSRLSGLDTYEGESQGKRHAGQYAILSGAYSADQQGYDISYVEGTLTIAQRALTLTALKAYDGTTGLRGYVGFGNLVEGEDLAYTDATSNDSHVLTGKYVKTITLADGTNGFASDYRLPDLTAASESNKVTINPRDLAMVAEKGYDGTTGLTGYVVLRNLVEGEDLRYSNATSNDSHVLTGKYVKTITLADGDRGFASDYRLPDLTAASESNKVTINPRDLAMVAEKGYDGTTGLTGYVVLRNLVEGEDLRYSNATSNDSHVLTGKFVKTISLEDGTNGLASDYRLPDLTVASESNSVTISQRNVGLRAEKAYDGTTGLTGHVVFDNLVEGEDLAYTDATSNDAHVAAADKYVKTIRLVNGSKGLASDYALPSLTSASAKNTVMINPKVLNLEGTKYFDGNATFDASRFGDGGVLQGVGSEKLILKGSGSVASSSNLEVKQELVPGDLILTDGPDGGSSSDYTLAGGTHSGTIRNNMTPNVTTLTAQIDAEIMSDPQFINSAFVSVSAPGLSTIPSPPVVTLGNFTSTHDEDN